MVPVVLFLKSYNTKASFISIRLKKQAREFENNGKNRYKFENIIMEFRICGIRTER